MNPVMKSAHEFSLAELKEKSRERVLRLSGMEAELIMRLNEANSSGE